MKSIGVSVLMTTYNEKESWLRKAIESILNQTYKNFEFIIIIDNPKNDQIISIVDEYSQKDNRIKKYVNEENIGLVNSLNKGIDYCNYEYIARFDADEICMFDRLERQVEFMEKHQDIDLLGGGASYIDENDNLIKKFSGIVSKHSDLKRTVKYNNVFLHPTYMFKKESINKIGRYRMIKHAEDYDLIARLILGGYKVSNLNCELIKCRIRSNGVSKQNFDAQIRSSFYIKKYFRKYEKNANKIILDNNEVFIDNNKLTILEKLIYKKDKAILKIYRNYVQIKQKNEEN